MSAWKTILRGFFPVMSVLSGMGSGESGVFRDVGHPAFNHQYALAHNRVEFDIFDYFGAFKFDKTRRAVCSSSGGMRFVLEHLHG